MAAPAPPPPVPTVDWFTIARHALDHIGLQGPNGALLSDVILETSCAETLMPHIWRVLRSHAELRFFSGAEQAGWRDWQLVAHTPVNSEQLAAMELEEAGQLRVLPSRQLHAKALWAGEYYESFFKDGRASDQWRALHEIGRRGAAGVLQNELCKLLEVASKHLFYSLAVLQRLGLIVEDWVGRVTTVHGRHNPQPTRRPPRAASAARLPCGSPSAQACLASRLRTFDAGAARDASRPGDAPRAASRDAFRAGEGGAQVEQPDDARFRRDHHLARPPEPL